ncbi:hypothetical protein K8O96_09035 [Clostridium sporogenes]|uniref:Uncharacterized protein n=1 Tax=Clostridium botulinum TaxID=1491 RepID=A0A6M0SYX2_CLOBO|nr:hypothetical protein [Clostridium sporogenes]NFA60696.1 hypothetical protein [Clostridium botulinum]NFI74146.1 hypothetical protein [Clostridium sporogenes]NFL71860.1 hypothetical protein [Clostridium sporogenes]NFM23960.1 hypothetical protein [Clostridium sporogenes]NFP62020.1 hypothetical protein [Clostridium sporogenes]
MNKYKDLFLCLILFILGISIWIYKMIITSDIPVNISFKQFILLSITIFLYALIQYFHINKFKSNLYLFNLSFLIILSLLWIGNLTTALKYNYNKYDTIIDIMASILSIIIIFINLNSIFNHHGNRI